jgi:hypothetical protein
MPDMKVPINPDTKEPEDDPRVGFNLEKERLRCLIVLNDQVADALSSRAGNAFFRAFVVEDCKTGEVWCKQRFRYVDSDSWSHMHHGPDQQKLSIDGRVKFFVDGIEKVLLTGLTMMAGGATVPKGVVTCFYPPNPEDQRATLEWLIQQDLVEMTQVIAEDGKVTPVSKQAEA